MSVLVSTNASAAQTCARNSGCSRACCSPNTASTVHSTSARALLTRLSGHNALLGGAQLGIQVVLSLVRQLLLVAAPLTGGLSLAPAAPVAIAQAALAVHTTRRTGRLAAAELIKGAERGGKPGALMRRLSHSDPQVRQWLNTWQHQSPASARSSLQALLP